MPTEALPLAKHVAIVTGASSGKGLAVAEAIGAAGSTVVINYNSHAEPACELAAKFARAVDEQWLPSLTLHRKAR